MITATNKATGEVVELPSETLDEVVTAWRIAQEYEKTAKALKDQLKQLVPTYVTERGTSEEAKGAMFRVSSIQRMTYDKAIVREVLDEDTYDLFTKVDKTSLDKYLKENLADLGDVSTRLRTAMIPDGKPYEVIKLERLER